MMTVIVNLLTVFGLFYCVYYLKVNMSPGRICQFCGKEFNSTLSNFRRHLKVSHGYVEDVQNSCRCLESECDFKCHKITELRSHLLAKHDINHEGEELVFKNTEDFVAWKEELQLVQQCSWIKQSGSKGTTDYYICNRSGKKRVVPNEERQRSIKTQGSCKTDVACTSGIISKKQEDGTIMITYYKVHYGHELNLVHNRLSTNVKNSIAMQLLQGVPSAVILDKIRENVDEEFERIHLVTNQDILNIGQAYNVHDKSIRDKNDAISVDLWVDEVMQNDNTKILVYKKQGENDKDGIFNKNDFQFAFMSKSQGEILKKFGENGIICMDATHGTNAYDFKLITILTVDEYGEGFPIAFLFSNREDYTSLKVFITAIKNYIGDIHAAVFMSDDAEQYYAAWSSTMNCSGSKKLLCTWHVDKAWRNKISLIKNRTKQTEMYKILCTIRLQNDQTKFDELVASLITRFNSDEELTSFGNYFKSNYLNRPTVWAACHRLGSGINTNMHLEAMHKTLKHVYLQGKVCKRLDKTIYVLQKFIRDKQFNRILKIYKGKNSGKLQECNKRHTTALSDNNMKILKRSEDDWIVSSAEKKYLVVKTSLSDHNCQINCAMCGACVHMFQCNCLDFLIHANICKHIHKVCIEIGNPIAQYNNSEFNENNTAEIEMHLETLKKPINTDKVKKIIIEDLNAVLAKIQNIDNPELLNNISRTVKTTLSLVSSTSLPKPLLTTDKSTPANKKVEQQIRFTSTKKPSQRKPGLTKPTMEEKEEIETSLLEK